MLPEVSITKMMYSLSTVTPPMVLLARTKSTPNSRSISAVRDLLGPYQPLPLNALEFGILLGGPIPAEYVVDVAFHLRQLGEFAGQLALLVGKLAFEDSGLTLDLVQLLAFLHQVFPRDHAFLDADWLDRLHDH